MMETIRSRNVACLVNPRAANSKWLRRKFLRAYLQKRLPGKVFDSLGDMRTTIEKAVSACRECDVIVAIGGDGTIADALQGIFEAGRAGDVLFGVVPFGSGNAFRKAFGIPKSARRAIDCLAEGVARPIDLLEVEGRVAAFASVGATALVTGEKLERPVHGLWGHVLAGRKLFRSPRDEKTIELEDGCDASGPFDRRTVTSGFLDCVVAKTSYFGYSWRIAPQAVADDGYLDITLFEMGPLRYVFLFPFIYFGLAQRRMRHFKARRAVISGRELPVQFNGEFLGRRDRVEFRVLPKAIRMLCPPSRSAKVG